MTVQTLCDVMEFDHVVRVGADGSVSDTDMWAPEIDLECDADGQVWPDDESAMLAYLRTQGWLAYTVGYSGQWNYRGPIMHPSEYIGGRLERDILSEPGLYVALVVDTWPEGADESEPVGWLVAYRDLPEDEVTS